MPERIDHVAIIVRSLEQALLFYRDMLGITPSEIKDVPTEQVRIAFLPLGGPGGSEIELIEPTIPNSHLSAFLEKRGEGLHHVALRVPDLAGAVERLKAGGARILNEPRRGAGGHEYVFVHPSSTGGVLVELIQDSEAGN